MSPHFERLVSGLKMRAPATENAVSDFQRRSAVQLPQQYLDFLRVSNGAEGFIGNKYVIFWPIEELLELNEAYQVDDYAPGLFLFGSSGGGEAYAFDTRSSMSVVKIPFVGMDLRAALHVAPTFNTFIEATGSS